jgi:hypothetical protein
MFHADYFLQDLDRYFRSRSGHSKATMNLVSSGLALSRLDGGDGWLHYLRLWLRLMHVHSRLKGACRAISEPCPYGSSRMVWKPSLSRLVLRGKHQTMDLAGVQGDWE